MIALPCSFRRFVEAIIGSRKSAIVMRTSGVIPMKKLIKTLLTVGATLSLLLVGTAPAFAYSAPNSDVQRILDDTNAARASNGLPALVLNEQMTSVAQNWSQQQASAGSMSHNPSYSTQIPGGWSAAAENVAYGYAANDVTNGWMNSDGHRKNILGDFNSVGIGIKDGYYTQVFAKYPNTPPPAPTQPTPDPEVQQPAPVTPAPVQKPEPVVVQPAPTENSIPIEAEKNSKKETKEAGLVDPSVKTDEHARDSKSSITELNTPMTTMDDNSEAAEVAPEEPASPLLIGIIIASSVLLAVAIFFLVRILRKK
jgi:hypothetical protein